MQIHGSALAVILATAALVGCTDPVVGRWEGDELQCGLGGRDRVTFDVDDELRGDGEYCECEFSFDVDPRGGESYRFDIDFDGPCFVDDGKYDCDLERDGERLDCGRLGDYTFVGD
jgi:hypothetical protein